MLGLNNARRTLLYVALVALLLVAHASAAPASPADTCDPASAQCCACEPGSAAEPASLPRLYLPAVMHGVRMSSEYTPAQPIVTPEPEVPVTGDVQ